MVLWVLKNLEPRLLLRTVSLVSKKMKRLCDAEDLWYGKMVQSQVFPLNLDVTYLACIIGITLATCGWPRDMVSPCRHTITFFVVKLTHHHGAFIPQWIVDQEVRDTWCRGLGAKKAFRVLCQVGWLQGSWVLEERPRGGILHCCLKADGIFASVR